MKITKKGEYALKALLALTFVHGECTLSLKKISKKEKAPYKFLEQIMTLLKKAGFVQSVQGKYGGYSLARSPEKITLGEVIRAIEGPIAPFGGAKEIKKKIQAEEHHPGLYVTLLEVRDAISEILDKKTLTDICTKSLELTGSKSSYQMYHI
ncbi:MAG: Rrf2 family transcriptional regulator [Candidatus Omnitrophica bacterium]|nr:Rrf2 family transcriptional regulator [Candidatus Omnitrophota bacterium]